MKHIVYTDPLGYKRRALVKDTDGEPEAQFGIPAGPPDMRQIDWNGVAREINNVLADLGVFTWQDAQVHPQWKDACANVVKRALIPILRQDNHKE